MRGKKKKCLFSDICCHCIQTGCFSSDWKDEFPILATFPGIKPSFKGTEPGPQVTEIQTVPRESEILHQFAPL